MAVRIDLASAQVLVTGASQGIGLGLAARFLAAGAIVLVTGRDQEKLQRAAATHPGLETLTNDIGAAHERHRLADYVRSSMPGLNIVVNNAGIQRRVPLAQDNAPWSERQSEIDILLAAPVHLNHLLIPAMLAHGRPSLIVNVSSGGALIPQPFAPMYSACKAALHSYTINLRHALAATACNVVEVVPPAVRTGLAGSGATHGAPLDEFCDRIFSELQLGNAAEIGYAATATPALQQRLVSDRTMFDGMAGRFDVPSYG